MSSTLAIVDTAGTTLFDLNGTNGIDAGSVTCSLLHNPTWAAPTKQFSRFEPSGSDGGTTSFYRAGLTQASIPIRIQATTYDNLATAVGRLSLLLSQGCVMKWIPNGSSVTKYADIEPTDTPVYFDGRELAMYEATSLFDTPQGVTLNLTRQPYFRGGELDPAVNLAVNSTLLTVAGGTLTSSAPDSWTWSVTTNISAADISASQEAFVFTVATGSQRGLQQTTPAATAAASDVWVGSFYAKATASGAKAECVIRYMDAASTLLGSESSSGLVTLTTAWQRITVVSSAAPATTDHLRITLRMDNDDATSYTVYFKNAQIEEATAVSTFRCGVESMSNDPTVTPGRVTYFYNAGDAPAPVRCKFTGSSSHHAIVGVKSSGGVAGTNALTNYANYASFQQCESCTQGTATSTEAIGATASGSSSDTSTTTFATNNLTVNRLTWTLSANQLAGMVGGRFQVWVRAYADDVNTEADLQIAYGFSAATADETVLPITHFAPDNAATFYDHYLGSIQIPDDAYSLVIWFRAQRTTGTGNMNWDLFATVPADVTAGAYGSDTSTWSFLETDPSIPRVAKVDSADLVQASLDAEGPVPFIAPPGLSAVYVLRTSEGVGGYRYKNGTFESLAAKFTYSPRYYA